MPSNRTLAAILAVAATAAGGVSLLYDQYLLTFAFGISAQLFALVRVCLRT